MPDKIMSILAEATGGKSYKAHKLGFTVGESYISDLSYGNICQIKIS